MGFQFAVRVVAARGKLPRRQSRFFFFHLFIHCSHATYDTLQAPLCPPPRPVPRKCVAHQGNDEGKERASVSRKETSSPASYSSPANAMKSDVGSNSRYPWYLAPLPPLPAPLASTAPPAPTPRSRRPAPRLALLPTSAEERKSSTARLRLLSARRSRIFHLSFHLPVSFRTSAHWIFFSAFHSGHTWKRCSQVWCQNNGRPEMTAARVSERWLGRQSSVLYNWQVPQACCISRECSSFVVVSINQFTIFISIDPYIPTYGSGASTTSNEGWSGS